MSINILFVVSFVAVRNGVTMKSVKEYASRLEAKKAYDRVVNWHSVITANMRMDKLIREGVSSDAISESVMLARYDRQYATMGA